MTVQTSLDYQKKFFNGFSAAWTAKSVYRLYQGIDATAETLRLPLAETPGYILAYDQAAQAELGALLRSEFIVFLRRHIPFFEVTEKGSVFFGDWYHRRQFGAVDTISRSIIQQNDAQAAILPHLLTFAEDPDHYLDNQLGALRADLYQETDALHDQLEAMSAEAMLAPEPMPAPPPSPSTGGSLRGLLKNFIDPSDERDERPAPVRSPQLRSANAQAQTTLRTRLDAAKAEADAAFDEQKRQLEVDAAVTRYEYLAVRSVYETVADFQEVLVNLPADFMAYLAAKEGTHNA